MTRGLESLERGSKGYDFALHTTQAQALSHGAMAREGHAKVFNQQNTQKNEKPKERSVGTEGDSN